MGKSFAPSLANMYLTELDRQAIRHAGPKLDLFSRFIDDINIIPVLKAGKDESDPSSYHPIALMSWMCKIMEHMINDRLVWYL